MHIRFVPAKRPPRYGSVGVLLSSEAGTIYCWSLYGERKLMGSFYGPSKVNESILTMCTDSTNRYFVSADTTGQIRLWDIRDYCCSTVSPVRFDVSPPPLVHSWQAHRLPITFCQWTDYNGYGNFLFTASTDYTARLWTIHGEEIGIFGQKQPWNIGLLSSSPLPDNQFDEQGLKSPVASSPVENSLLLYSRIELDQYRKNESLLDRRYDRGRTE